MNIFFVHPNDYLHHTGLRPSISVSEMGRRRPTRRLFGVHRPTRRTFAAKSHIGG